MRNFESNKNFFVLSNRESANYNDYVRKYIKSQKIADSTKSQHQARCTIFPRPSFLED
jgi:hypothetical protein